MNKPAQIYFVWVNGVRGATCEIVYGLDQNVDSHGKEKKKILQQHQLPIEYKDLSLKQLEIIYPYIEGMTE